MHEAEGDGEVRVQVDRVPGFVRGHPASRPHGCDADDHEQDQAHTGPHDVGIGREQVEGLADRAAAIGHAVADGREDEVGE